MVDFLCTLIGVYTDVLILYIFLDKYEEKISKMAIRILFASYGVINIILNMYEVEYIIKLCLCVVLSICIILLAYQYISLSNAIKCIVAFFTLLGIGELLVIPIMIWCKGIYDIEIFYSETLTSAWAFTLIVSRSITLILIKGLGKYWYKKEVKKTKIERVLIYFPLFMAFFTAVVIERYLIDIEKMDKQDLVSVLIIISVLLLAFTLTHMKLLEKNIVMQQQEKQIVELQHRNEVQYLYYEEKNKYENEIKRIRHDLKNHLLLIKDMKEVSNKNYYTDLLDIVSNDDVINSGCNVFDVLINEKRKQAKQDKTIFEVYVMKNIECLNNIEERDLCSIFGNLLDNAIENASKVENAKISINVDIINNFFVLFISNTYDSKRIKKSNGRFLSTKENVNMHGIGLQSVQMALEKYDGLIKIDHDQLVFKVELMLPLNNKWTK